MRALLILCTGLWLCTSCSPRPSPHAHEGSAKPSARQQTGLASYYADSLHGKQTASGEPYDKHALTAAHRKLPFGTTVKVTNTRNGATATVRINDRGPFVHGRIIDLSRAAAQKIGMIDDGVVPVTVTPQ